MDAAICPIKTFIYGAKEKKGFIFNIFVLYLSLNATLKMLNHVENKHHSVYPLTFYDEIREVLGALTFMCNDLNLGRESSTGICVNIYF